MKSVYWIRYSEAPKLAIVARPRGDDWLEDDLAALKREGIDVVVSLLTESEAEELGLGRERGISEAIGMQFVSYPIPDRTIPMDKHSFQEFILSLEKLIKSGLSVGVHCRGCIGRSTVTTAAVLIQLGWDARKALAVIEESRGCPVPDTEEQRDWIRQYAAAGSQRD
jgi:protein-tyrosine phosphatase